jgi:hypothetical protein
LRWLHPYVFYGTYVLLIGIYFKSLLSLFDSVTGGAIVWPGRLLFAALLLLSHAGIVRLVSVLLLDKDYPWFLQAGVAGQYVLGAMLQPSVFGVLIVAALALLTWDRPWAALTCSSLSAVMHSTYLLPAAFFTMGCLLTLAQKGSWRRALALGAWSLALVTPVLAYNWVQFAPTDAARFARAQHILAHVRIPHHAVPARWMDGIAWLQVAWMALGIAMTWRTRLFTVLATMFVLGLTLSLVQAATDLDTLALMFPWRVSVILMPVATMIVLARLVQRMQPWLAARSPTQANVLAGISAAAILSMAGMGAAISAFGWGYHTNREERPLLAHVQEHARPNEVYLLPVAIPTKVSRGAVSTAFTPAPIRDKDQALIAIDLQSFRLSTGRPIVVDFKSIPYCDAEVLEWHDRLLQVKHLYDRNDWSSPETRATLERWKVTHVVVPSRTARTAGDASLPSSYDDGVYRVYEVAPR